MSCVLWKIYCLNSQLVSFLGIWRKFTNNLTGLESLCWSIIMKFAVFFYFGFHLKTLKLRGRYRISRKRGRGVSRVRIFHTWTFCSGTYHAVHGQHTGGQNASQNCKGGTKCWPFYGTGRPKCQYYQNILYMILMIK